MKKLIVVRHGEYGPTISLNNLERNQIGSLTDRLHRLVDGASILLLSSTALRASESADILGKAFHVEVESHYFLWSANRYKVDFPAVLELVQSRQDMADVIILVTHLEYVEGFPAYFCERVLGIRCYTHSIGKGQAVVIDCQNKTVEFV